MLKNGSFRVLVLSAVAMVGVTATVIGVAGPSSDGSPKSTFSLEQARNFTEFPVYSAGPTADGAPLVAVLRRNDTANYVSFIYGKCDATADAGCSPSAEVQVWPACVRNPSLYEGRRSPVSPVAETTVVRGVPGAFFDNGTRLELQTGASTVVVFANGYEATRRIANGLQGVNVSAQPGNALSQPAVGALDGTLECAS